MKLWVPPDGEKILIDYLHKHRNRLGCGVSSIKLAKDVHVQVLGTGGTAHTAVSDWCQLTVTCWAARNDWDTARTLASTVRGLIDAAADAAEMAGVVCYGAEWLALPYNDQDPLTGAARVTQTIRIALRGRYE